MQTGFHLSLFIFILLIFLCVLILLFFVEFNIYHFQLFLLINNNMLTQNSLHRSRPLIQGSRNATTNRLYSPLREALIECSKSKQKSRLNYLHTNNDLKCSAISEKARMIDPVQAEYLIKSIYVPSDDQLRPTHNLQRIKGKSFVAIQVNVKESAPISQQQFTSRLSKTNSMDKIVYEVDQSNHDFGALNTPMKIYPDISSKETVATDFRNRNAYSIQSRNTYNKNSELTQSTLGKEVYGKINIENYKEPDFSNNDEKSRVQISDFMITEKDKKQQKIIHPYFPKDDINNPILPLTKFQIVAPLDSSQKDNKNKRVTKNLTQSSNSGISLSNSQQKNNLSKFSIVSQRKNYKDNQNASRNQETKKGFGRGLKLIKNSNQYKYNIFSCLDEPVNSGCSSCGKVQIFASKRQNLWS